MSKRTSKRIKKTKINKPKNKSNNFLIYGAIAAILILGVVFALSNSNSDTKHKNIKLPDYAYTNPMTLNAYTYATEHPDILEQMPCYCGCGNMGHRFLRDCFINDDRTYDDHASFCDICVGENLKIQSYLNQGMSLKQTREKIDSEYSKYIDGKTNTPPVSDNYIPILS